MFCVFPVRATVLPTHSLNDNPVKREPSLPPSLPLCLSCFHSFTPRSNQRSSSPLGMHAICANVLATTTHGAATMRPKMWPPRAAAGLLSAASGPRGGGPEPGHNRSIRADVRCLAAEQRVRESRGEKTKWGNEREKTSYNFPPSH